MPRLPIISGKVMVRALEKAGFLFLDQKGSHVIMIKNVGGRRLKPVIPMHEELKIGTLLSVLRQAELTREDLFRLLKR